MDQGSCRWEKHTFKTSWQNYSPPPNLINSCMTCFAKRKSLSCKGVSLMYWIFFNMLHDYLWESCSWSLLSIHNIFFPSRPILLSRHVSLHTRGRDEVRIVLTRHYMLDCNVNIASKYDMRPLNMPNFKISLCWFITK